MGYDGKYGRVTTEHGDIGEDEPVVVFRAQDKTVPELLLEYYRICRQNGSSPFHLGLIEKTRERFLKWQNTPGNRTKIPNSDGPAGQRLKKEMEKK
jgi:hypothetical protein